MERIIDMEHDGMILRTYLERELLISCRLLSSLKKKPDGIILNGERVTVRAVLHEGDILSLNTDDTKESSVLPVYIPLDIIHEDSELLVINKPPHIPTHPSIKHYTDTLANGVVYYLVEKGENSLFRPITRLDKNTSGVTLIAKNAHSASRMCELMKSGRIEKTYLAIAEGECREKFTIDKNIKRERESILLRTVCGSDEGRRAITDFEPLECKNGLTLIKVRPRTGRTHQIRVHLASVLHPIVGDELYGHESDAIDRHALHAYSLRITYPDGNEQLFTAEMPTDMKKLLENT